MEQEDGQRLSWKLLNRKADFWGPAGSWERCSLSTRVGLCTEKGEVLPEEVVSSLPGAGVVQAGGDGYSAMAQRREGATTKGLGDKGLKLSSVGGWFQLIYTLSTSYAPYL